MSVTQFIDWSLSIRIGGLIVYMLFVMYRLAKESGAGSYGTLVIFLSLGLGIFGFAAKSLIQLLIDVWKNSITPERQLSRTVHQCAA